MVISTLLVCLGLSWCVICAIYEYNANYKVKEFVDHNKFKIKMWFRLNFIKINLSKKLKVYKVN